MNRRRALQRLIISLIGLVVFSNLLILTPQKHQRPYLRYRWVYIHTNLLEANKVERVLAIMRRAQAAGYNGVVLADYKFGKLAVMPPSYFRHVAQIQRTAHELHLEIYPIVCPMGYSNGLLAHDPNLAEGLPVREAPFIVKNGRADLQDSARPLLPGGDFEVASSNRIANWDLQDDPGTTTFADRTVTHGGHQSLRMQRHIGMQAGRDHIRIMKRVEVHPFRQYHLAVWIKTDHFKGSNNIRSTIRGEDKRWLWYGEWGVPSTQDWTCYHAVFNSLNNRSIEVYLGNWEGGPGTIWWDDARLEEVGLLNVLRREGCPLRVQSEEGLEYEEGRDYKPVRDEKLGVVPYAGEYEIYHTPPSLTLTAHTSIREGQRLRVSFYHSVLIHDEQVVCCLSDSHIYALIQDHIQRVDRLWRPEGFMLGHDEIRVAGWCAQCQARGLTPGQLLANNFRRCEAIVHTTDPKASVFVWSDMFDPYHNATANYHLINGSLEGSWKGLSNRAVVVNWCLERRQNSLRWFAKQGHAQIIADYYDQSSRNIGKVLEANRDVPGICGVMYTTWQDRYDDLEDFAANAFHNGSIVRDPL